MSEKSNLSLNIKEDILSDFPGSSACKESNYNAGDPGSIPGSGRSTGEGISYPLPYTGSSLVAQLVKESACNAGDLGLIPGLGRSSGKGQGYPLQYSGLESSMDCTVHGVARVRYNWATFTSLSLCHVVYKSKVGKALEQNLLCYFLFSLPSGLMWTSFLFLLVCWLHSYNDLPHGCKIIVQCDQNYMCPSLHRGRTLTAIMPTY